MASVAQLFFLYFIMNSIRTVLLVSIQELSSNDVIININKGYALQGLGIYSPNLVEKIVHSFVPLNNFCVASPTADVCVYDSKSRKTNLFELGTLMTSRYPFHSSSSYTRDIVSKLIGRDISGILAEYDADQVIIDDKSTVHVINKQVYQKNEEKVLMTMPSNNVVDSYSDIPHVRLTSAERVLQQINNNKICFDYLSQADLQLFLTAIFSSIRSSYTISNVQDLLDTFIQLIVGQSVFALRYCSLGKRNSLSSQPCLVISTLFLHIPVDSVSTFSVYRLIPLPITFNHDRYIYSNLPKVIGINSNDQTLVMWNDDLAINQCTFSSIVLCQYKPVSVSLSKPSCLSQLLHDQQLPTGLCEISRSQNIEQDVLRIADGIWLFYNVHRATYCQVYSNINELPETFSITEAAVLHMPCNKTITCADFQLPSEPCKEKRVIITPSLTSNLHNLSHFIIPIKNMPQMIASSYHVQSEKSIEDMMIAFQSKKSNLKETIRELAMYILSFVCFIFVAILLYIIKLIKYKIQTEINKIQKEVNGLDSQIQDILDF